MQAKAVAPAKGGQTIFDLIEKQKQQVARALPSHMSSERFIRIVMTELRRNPRLGECTPPSLLGAMMVAAQLGLEPGPLGLCYLIPRYNKKTGTLDVQLQIGYQGLCDLVTRDPNRVLNVVPRTVHENDHFDYRLGTKAFIDHKPARGAQGKSVAWYAVATLANGSEVFDVMYPEDIEHYRKFSENASGSTWTDNYDAMAMKTVLKRLCKYLPKSVEVLKALAADESVQTEIPSMGDVIDVTVVEETGEVVDIVAQAEAELDATEVQGYATPMMGENE